MIVNLRYPFHVFYGTFHYVINILDDVITQFYKVPVIHRDTYVDNALNILTHDIGDAIKTEKWSDVWWGDTVLYPYRSRVSLWADGLFNKNYVLSKFVAKNLKKSGVRVDGIYPYPLNMDIFSVTNNWGSWDFDLMTLGKQYWDDRKNIRWTIRIAEELGLKTVVVSEKINSDAPNLVRVPSETISDMGKARLMGASKVFAFPTTCEGLGMPALEAMAVGTPVIYGGGHATGEYAWGFELKPLSFETELNDDYWTVKAVYDFNEFRELVLYAINMGRDEWEDMSLKSKEIALNYQYDAIRRISDILKSGKLPYTRLDFYDYVFEGEEL